MATEFFLQNTSEYKSHFDYDHEVSAWTAEGAATRSRITTDTDHPSCMEISSGVDGAGVYYTVSCQAGTKYVFELAYKNVTPQELDIVIYDVTNSANIATKTLTEVVWSVYFTTFTTPATCVSMRIYLRAGTNSAPIKLIYIDDIVLQGNALGRNPDRYDPRFPIVKNEHTVLKGRVIDQSFISFGAGLSWNALTAAEFLRIFNTFKEKDATYFDDTNVPQMVEEAYVYVETTFNFLGITNPSATHTAWDTASASLPAAAADFEGTEFSTADYTAIGADDVSATDHETYASKSYIYEKYDFKVTEYDAATQVRSINVKWIGSCLDGGTSGAHGVTLYVWNYISETWVEIGRSRTSDSQTLNFTTTRPEQASEFVDVATGHIRLLVRSNAMGDGQSTHAIVLESDFVEVIVNKDMDATIELSNKAVLSAGRDVVSVQNITDGTTLTLTTHYTIGDDRQSVILVNETAGDLIRVTYNQYYYVSIDDLADPRLQSPDLTIPLRNTSITLNSLAEVG